MRATDVASVGRAVLEARRRPPHARYAAFMQRNVLIAGILAALTVFTVVTLVRRRPDDPERAIRTLLTRSASGVEANDLGAIVLPVSERFKKDELNRAEITRMIFGLLRRGAWSRVLIVGLDVRVDDGKRTAKASMKTAMARGQNIKTLQDLRKHPTEVDLYLFDLTLELEDDGWRVTTGEWRPLRFEEILGQ